MISSTRGLIVLTVLTVVIALIVTFPARVAYSWLAPPLVQVNGLKGTIWNGSAREFATNGVYLRDLSWHMRPLRLLTGKAHYDISGTPVSGFFESEVAIGFGGNVTLTNLSAAVPLQMFAAAANIAGLRGDASLQFDHLELEAGRATAMDGIVNVADLFVPMLANTSLGGYRAEFFTQENGIVASIEDSDGVVDLAGSLTLNPDKSYAFIGQVVQTSKTPKSLSNQLRYVPANERGQHEVRLEGQY